MALRLNKLPDEIDSIDWEDCLLLVEFIERENGQLDGIRSQSSAKRTAAGTTTETTVYTKKKPKTPRPK